MLSLFELLQGFGLDKAVEAKLYRHVDHDSHGYAANIEEIYSRGDLSAFQSIQSKHILGQGYLISFVGEENRLSRFVGIWRIEDHGSGGASTKTLSHLDFADYALDSDHWYELKKDHRFDALIDRLVIRWPVGIAFHRWLIDPNGELSDFEVHSIRAIGFSHTFPGFDELIISNADLVTLVSKGDGGAGWIEALRSTRGIYLITDTVSGELYVGSATGADGIWGRWQNYGKTVHGGNKVLLERCDSDPNFKERLQYSILETLGNLATRKEGLEAESRWKRKLGKKATTLNKAITPNAS